jgi:hypothetical protein
MCKRSEAAIPRPKMIWPVKLIVALKPPVLGSYIERKEYIHIHICTKVYGVHQWCRRKSPGSPREAHEKPPGIRWQDPGNTPGRPKEDPRKSPGSPQEDPRMHPGSTPGSPLPKMIWAVKLIVVLKPPVLGFRNQSLRVLTYINVWFLLYGVR